MLQRFHKIIAAVGWRTAPYTARSEGPAALTLGRAIEQGLADE
jgi:hypothetical protein